MGEDKCKLVKERVEDAIFGVKDVETNIAGINLLAAINQENWQKLFCEPETDKIVTFLLKIYSP